MSTKNKKSNKRKLNDQLNKAIATTVVVTAIGITSTMNTLPVKAGSHFEVNKKEEMQYVDSAILTEQLKPEITELDLLDMNELITKLLKEGSYKEAREIRKSFTKYTNPLAKDLRSLNNYAVTTS